MPETDSEHADAEERQDEERQDEEQQGEQTPDAEALRREAAKWRRELRAAQKTNDDLRAELERHRVESESDIDRAKREAVEEAKQQWDSEHAAERLHSRLRARAAGKMRDPDDAVLHLGGTLDPDADNAAIDEALEQLIKERNYLALPEGNGERADSFVTQGVRSQTPGSGHTQTPDDWIRKQVRGQ